MTTILYHGTNKTRGNRMLINKEQIISRGDGHWLGDGLYMFPDFVYVYKWIVDMYNSRHNPGEKSPLPEYNRLIDNYMILQFTVTLNANRLFDLTKPEFKILFDFTLKEMKDKGKIPDREMPEGVVLNYMFEELSYDDRYDAIKAMFTMYKNQYKFKARLNYMPQVQICIRNWDIVKTIEEYNFEDKVEKYNNMIGNLYYDDTISEASMTYKYNFRRI